MDRDPASSSSPDDQLSSADDRIDPGRWAPPRAGVVPKIRIGRSWVSVLWGIPVIFVLLVLFISLAQELRKFPAVEDFIMQYPGAPAGAPTVESGFPLWIRLQHFFNLFLMVFVLRSGVQILADHPRLYWNRNCTPGTEWFRFQKDVPQDRIWTSKDDAVTLPGWLGIPGLRHSVGLARWWHFSTDLLWFVNGVVFCILLFLTEQWVRIVPVGWDIFPNMLSVAIQYLSLDFPEEHAWTQYNSLQQVTYFITIFIAAPAAILTGLMQGPAISNKLGWFGRVLNRQRARSIHFAVFLWFLGFIVIHVTLVFITGLRSNLNMMFAGVHDQSWAGLFYFLPGLALVGIAWGLASPFTIKHARFVQRVGTATVGWLKGLAEWWDPTSQLQEQDISPFFWSNGMPPVSEDYEKMLAERFVRYKLRLFGLVENPVELSIRDLKKMHRQEQITTHFCIQGWSGVAKWGGVPMRDILDLVRPKEEARYVVFYSMADGPEGGTYYDVHEIANMRHELTILAYEMNGEPLSVMHGAPLRLRCENELGFKMVKWIKAIEFVEDFGHLGAGHGGYHEDHEFYGYRMPI